MPRPTVPFSLQRHDGNMTKPVMPVFVFARRPVIEHHGGLLLAGILVVDLPKPAKENKRNMRLVEEIVQELIERAQSGVLGGGINCWLGWSPQVGESSQSGRRCRFGRPRSTI
jgi:hypothetical protein